MTEARKKKRRTLGSFPCPDCDKVFTRLDHLSRHHLNHQPKEVFVCEFMVASDSGPQRCGKRFVRRDLKERHIRRHLELGQDEDLGDVGAVVSTIPKPPLQPMDPTGPDAASHRRFSVKGEYPGYLPPGNGSLIPPPIPIPQTMPQAMPQMSQTQVNQMSPFPPYVPPMQMPYGNGEQMPFTFPPPNLPPGVQASPEYAFSQSDMLSWLFTDLSMAPPKSPQVSHPEMNFDVQDLHFFQNDNNPLDEMIKTYQQKHGPSTLPLLTADSNTTPKTDTLLPEIYEFNPTEENLHSLIVEHGSSRNLPNKRHLYVDVLLINSLAKSVGLDRHQLETIFESDIPFEDRISYYIGKYWDIFHPQYLILHKPTFDTKTALPLLLLVMSVIGCNYSALMSHRQKRPQFNYSMRVCVPMRFEVFQHPDFRSPVKLWVLQTLNLLEFCEKNFLLRDMHERAHIHHGTTVQLLRRLPLLGGNPSSANVHSGGETSTDTEHELSEKQLSDNESSDAALFGQWVEAESMKRITFMTFYLDVMDYVKFRHNPLITFHQFQLLNLPCDDDHLWNTYELNGSFRKIVKRQKRLESRKKSRNFINALKRVLKPDDEPAQPMSIFTKKILFAGLVSIMHSMQQTDLQNSSSVLTANGIVLAKKSQAWKEILSRAIDNWSIDTNCYGGVKSIAHRALSHKPYQCKFPMIHLTQIIGMADINHYDIAIFGGLPANQSVLATSKDHHIVRRKLNNMWLRHQSQSRKLINDIINLKSVIHCYLLLWETMLKPANDVNSSDKNYNSFLEWTVENDYYDSMYAIGVATLVLWSYAFSTYGLESQRYTDIKERDYEKLVEFSAEGGYQYLLRVRQEFQTNLRKNNLHNDYHVHPFILLLGQTPDAIITKYCDLLPFITNKHNILGLCFLVGTKLLDSQWEVIRENAKLIINCGMISIGKPNITCEDVFNP